MDEPEPDEPLPGMRWMALKRRIAAAIIIAASVFELATGGGVALPIFGLLLAIICLRWGWP
jgi:hypothetical protein